VRRQGRRPLEALAALGTGEAAVDGVDGLVLTQTDHVAEGLAAGGALVGPTTSAMSPSGMYLK